MAKAVSAKVLQYRYGSKSAAESVIILTIFPFLQTLGNFFSDPVFHQLEQRITAHFMICYTALLIFRILQKKFEIAGFRFSPNDIVETLNNMQVNDMGGFCCQATYKGSRILTALNTIYPLSGLDHKYYLPKVLNKKFKKISG